MTAASDDLPRFLGRSGMFAIAIGLPFLLSLINADWLGNAIGDLDTWFYYGYFKLMRTGALADVPAWDRNYFESRLPFNVPGWVTYSLLPDWLASRVLHIVLLNGVSALSLWSVARTHLSRGAAAAVTVWMICDLYYLRTIGWDYVDSACVAYATLALALITHSAKGGWAAFAGAGFCVASMLMSHLMSVVWVPVLTAYYLFVVHPGLGLFGLARRMTHHVLPALAGVAACCVIYGLMSQYLFGGPFTFFLQQLNVATGPIKTFASPMGALALKGYWLTVPFAVTVAAILVLFVRQGPLRLPTHAFGRFWIAAVAVIYPGMFVVEQLNIGPYLSRNGMYVSHVFAMAYLAVASIIFGNSSRAPSLIGYVCFPVVAIVRLLTHGDGLYTYWPIPMLIVASVQAITMLVAGAMRETRWLSAALVLFSLTYLFVPSSFSDDRSVRRAHAYIVETAPGTLPKVAWPQFDANAPTFRSIAASMTDHGDGRRADRFPELTETKVGQVVAVLQTEPASLEKVTARMQCAATVSHFGSKSFEGSHRNEYTPIGYTAGTDFSVHLFRIESLTPEKRCP